MIEVFRDYSVPEVPFEINDAVEMWARKSGRHGRITWVPQIACFVVELSMPPDSPIWKAFRAGDLAEEPKERIQLMHWDGREGRYIPMKLEEYGASGIVEMLEKADVWSGRGEFESMTDALHAQIGRNEQARKENRERFNDLARDEVQHRRREILGLPLVSVPANIVADNADNEE
jgi:hypothetical protein